ncbi:hypothetical protein HU200_035256 [Digitaria exilis]|uniref:F-box domain-containing protein n=1 Tax=Digitaria exilis TaxID=1010633 RepID=A0A835BJE1_9POAL|nr:hypothetical protein HU200_035256 [Digitaria exilis]
MIARSLFPSGIVRRAKELASPCYGRSDSPVSQAVRPPPGKETNERPPGRDPVRPGPLFAPSVPLGLPPRSRCLASSPDRLPIAIVVNSPTPHRSHHREMLRLPVQHQSSESNRLASCRSDSVVPDSSRDLKRSAYTMGIPRKRSKGGEANNKDLPPEIIDKILLLLPARSVFRFRAVCRSWAALLSSPTFTNAYTAAATATDARRTHNKFVVLAPSSGPSTVAYSCTSSTSEAEVLLTLDHIRTCFLSQSSRPSRGLLLVSDTRSLGRYWVCNPSTGECRALPLQPERGRVSLSSAGLAFDDLTMECKVVHLFFNHGKTEVKVRCEVLTLGAPWRWRPAACTGPNQLDGPVGYDIVEALLVEEAVAKAPPVFADGCLHWLMRHPRRIGGGVPPRQGQDAILRFSAADESFGLVSAPEGVRFEDFLRLEEHLPMGLAGMVHDLRHRGSRLDVWARGVQGEWSLDYRIPVESLLARDVHGPQFITVLGSTSNERLLVATSEHKDYSYATDTERVETVFDVGETSIGPQKEAPAELLLGLYEDSLIRIGGADESRYRVSSAVAQVLLRLPLESIARESFVATHVSIKRPRRIFIATNGRARGRFFRFAPLQSWLRASPADLADSLAIDSKIVCSSKPCHGLNLISTGTDDYLCNHCTGATECLGIRGRSRFTPYCSSAAGQPSRRHAFTVGRSVGLGFDHNTGEHVAVEIGHLCGALACILKASESDSWTCAGTPPMPVTDMPPAHVDGTLYWLGRGEQQRVVLVVAFNISTRAFDVIQLCEPPNISHHNDVATFLVELNNTLSLVVADGEAEEMEIWMMNMRLNAWVSVHRLCLRGHPDFSPRTAATAVVPMEISGDDGRILLSTGRTLGYYDAKSGAIDITARITCPSTVWLLYRSTATWLLLIEAESATTLNMLLLPVPTTVAEHPRLYFPIIGTFYSCCCKRILCSKCIRRCVAHHWGLHIPLHTIYFDVMEEIQSNAWPVKHPLVPDPDHYCYYYSAMNNDGDVVRHVFISRRDLVLGVLPCRGEIIPQNLVQHCSFRMLMWQAMLRLCVPIACCRRLAGTAHINAARTSAPVKAGPTCQRGKQSCVVVVLSSAPARARTSPPPPRPHFAVAAPALADELAPRRRPPSLPPTPVGHLSPASSTFPRAVTPALPLAALAATRCAQCAIPAVPGVVTGAPSPPYSCHILLLSHAASPYTHVF